MGKDFYENSPLARDIYDRASECLELDMRALCFEENDLLDQTEYTQGSYGDNLSCNDCGIE